MNNYMDKKMDEFKGFGVPFETKAYKEFREDIKKVISDESRFVNKKIKIFQKQMSIGKSFFMGRELPWLLKKHFTDLKFIIRISPTTEVADDDFLESIEFVKTIDLENGLNKFKTKNITDLSKEHLTDNLIEYLDTGSVYIFSVTHARFAGEFETFLKYADKSVLLIEEAHQFLAVGDEGHVKYGYGTGYKSPYDAKVAERLIQWSKINGRILAFTATPTLHHQAGLSGYGFTVEGTDEPLRDLFDVCNNLVHLDDLIETQSWLGEVIPYDFEERKPQNSVTFSVRQAIDSLFEREYKLEKLKEKDSNIQSKLTGLFMCGQGKGVWGCPIHANGHHDEGMVEIISDYLLSKWYLEDSKMIATLQDSGSGGNRIWDLSGNSEKIKGFDTIKNKMLDPNDPLRYLIVINRARSGISIMNLGAMVIAVVRDPLFSRTYIPLQIIGRMLRGNPGTGTRFTTKYKNNHSCYISEYSYNEGVDIETVVESYKIANHFDLWYPVDTHRKTLDVWGDAVRDLKNSYCNTIKDGFAWLHKLTCTKPPIEENFVKLPIDELLTDELLCPHCGESIFSYVKNKIGDGTLLPFFD